MSEVLDAAPGSVVLELLDTASGILLKSWSFPAGQRIVIGRADECDLVIANPYVSRAHAYLQWDADGWQAIAISTQQLVVNGQRKQSVWLREGDVFRLGTHGCDLKFRVIQEETKEFRWTETLTADPDACPLVYLDRDQIQREVAQIESDTYFKNLSQTVHKLKQARRST